jgi:hypothetical protein
LLAASADTTKSIGCARRSVIMAGALNYNGPNFV